MYSEILRIIEGGLNNDKRKIVSYANRLANHLKNDGNESLSKSIFDLLSRQSSAMATMDSMVIPVDIESRLKIVVFVSSIATVANRKSTACSGGTAALIFIVLLYFLLSLSIQLVVYMHLCTSIGKSIYM